MPGELLSGISAPLLTNPGEVFGTAAAITAVLVGFLLGYHADYDLTPSRKNWKVSGACSMFCLGGSWMVGAEGFWIGMSGGILFGIASFVLFMHEDTEESRLRYGKFIACGLFYYGSASLHFAVLSGGSALITVVGNLSLMLSGLLGLCYVPRALQQRGRARQETPAQP